MSGECEKCGEHALDCICKNTKIILKYRKMNHAFLIRIEVLESLVGSLIPLVDALKNEVFELKFGKNDRNK